MQNPSYKDGNHVCRSVITERLYIDIKQDKKIKIKKKVQNLFPWPTRAAYFSIGPADQAESTSAVGPCGKKRHLGREALGYHDGENNRPRPAKRRLRRGAASAVYYGKKDSEIEDFTESEVR